MEFKVHEAETIFYIWNNINSAEKVPSSNQVMRMRFDHRFFESINVNNVGDFLFSFILILKRTEKIISE